MALELKEALRSRILALGFDLCGFAAIGERGRSEEEFQRWLADGFHASMRYMERTAELRVNPQRLLPGARSVIVVAGSYWHDQFDSLLTIPFSNRQFRIARYAYFRDYHKVFRKALAQVVQVINQIAGNRVACRIFVDSAPVLERAWAWRAGLGFIGKHTGLISPVFGNWLLLGGVLTTLELEPDKPMNNLCGRCQRCLDACPTGALVSPFRLDSRRCISYWTIEQRGSIPVEMRLQTAGWLFGCDLCMEVCPWSRHRKAGQLLKPTLRSDLFYLSLSDWLSLSGERLRAWIMGTPLMRAGWAGLVRNACCVAAQLKVQSLAPLLAKLACSSDPVVAEHACWALQQVECCG